MHMWMWYGTNLGEFMFPNLNITTGWAFALTWIVLFIVAFLFEASKIYIAKVQKDAHRKFLPLRSDERRNLLCDREGSVMTPSGTRIDTGQSSHWLLLRTRCLVTLHQTVLFILHNTVGYLLMLAVMMYNFHLLIAVVLGMMLGYFLFGAQMIRLQMRCLSTKRVIICTPECDDTAESNRPPCLDSATTSETDLFACQTRTCITPSHYFPASASQDGASGDSVHVTCQFGAKRCPSKLAKINKMITKPGPSNLYHAESETDTSPDTEDQLLNTKRQGCCKASQNNATCCNKVSSQDVPVVVHVHSSENADVDSDITQIKEASPDIHCCRSTDA